MSRNHLVQTRVICVLILESNQQQETKSKTSKIIETLNCKFLVYHNQSFNLHFMFLVVKIVFQMTILHYFAMSFLSIETLVAKSLQYTGQLGTVICDNLIFCICNEIMFACLNIQFISQKYYIALLAVYGQSRAALGRNLLYSTIHLQCNLKSSNMHE